MQADKQLKIKAAFEIEFTKFKTLEISGEKWHQLERLHILGQLSLFLHLKVHWLMLNLAIEEAKIFEILGQIFRLVLVIPGHAFNKLPIGNVGTTRVSAFQRMEIPQDLRDLIN